MENIMIKINKLYLGVGLHPDKVWARNLNPGPISDQIWENLVNSGQFFSKFPQIPSGNQILLPALDWAEKIVGFGVHI